MLEFLKRKEKQNLLNGEEEHILKEKDEKLFYLKTRNITIYKLKE